MRQKNMRSTHDKNKYVEPHSHRQSNAFVWQFIRLLSHKILNKTVETVVNKYNETI